MYCYNECCNFIFSFTMNAMGSYSFMKKLKIYQMRLKHKIFNIYYTIENIDYKI